MNKSERALYISNAIISQIAIGNVFTVGSVQKGAEREYENRNEMRTAKFPKRIIMNELRRLEKEGIIPAGIKGGRRRLFTREKIWQPRFKV